MILSIVAFITVLFCIAVFLFFRRVVMPSSAVPCDPEWINEFSLDRYQPMLRLLDEQDYRYLKAQPGFTNGSLRAFRKDRRRIFRSYLRNLAKDFQRLHKAARITLLYSEEDRPELAVNLLRQQVIFSYAVAIVEINLMLHSLGLASVNVSRLLTSVDQMRLQTIPIRAWRRGRLEPRLTLA